MSKRRPAGTIGQLELSAGPSVLPGSFAFAALLAALLRRAGRTPAEAALVAGAALPLHWSADLWHQLGHAAAARATGFPMRGIHFWGLLSTSLYPEDEPPLPAEIHIQRALGGPAASLLAALVAAVLWRLARRPGPARDLARLALADHLLLGLGALLPLPFTDGGTLLAWWPRRQS
jgi:hypothetical protein